MLRLGHLVLNRQDESNPFECENSHSEEHKQVVQTQWPWVDSADHRKTRVNSNVKVLLLTVHCSLLGGEAVDGIDDYNGKYKEKATVGHCHKRWKRPQVSDVRDEDKRDQDDDDPDSHTYIIFDVRSIGNHLYDMQQDINMALMYNYTM